MGTKREEYRLRGGDILEIREFHDGRYGAPGQRREKKKKPTEEQMRQANEREDPEMPAADDDVLP